jgi:hypothetical protein
LASDLLKRAAWILTVLCSSHFEQAVAQPYEGRWQGRWSCAAHAGNDGALLSYQLSAQVTRDTFTITTSASTVAWIGSGQITPEGQVSFAGSILESTTGSSGPVTFAGEFISGQLRASGTQTFFRSPRNCEVALSKLH